MKKFSRVVVVVVLLTILMSLFVSCKKGEPVSSNRLLDEIDESAVVSGLSAFELASIAYYNWKNDEIKNYMRIEELDFAINEGKVASRHARQIYKQNGEDMYSEQVTINSGLAGKNYAVKLVLKGDDGFAYILNPGDKRVKGDKDDLYKIDDWGNPETYNMEDDEDQILDYKKQYHKMITSYDISQKEYLISTSNDTVYRYKKDSSKYIFTITIDMSKSAQSKQQKLAKEEFENALGIKKGSLEMEPVQITFVVEEFEKGNYRVLKWQSVEKYTATRIIKMDGLQTYTASFSYSEDDYTFSIK